jgi:hypothetical protein
MTHSTTVAIATVVPFFALKRTKMAERDQLKEANWITILNDDETFTSLGGSHVAILTAEQQQELKEGTELNDLDNLQRYDLKELVNWAIDHGYFDAK